MNIPTILARDTLSMTPVEILDRFPRKVELIYEDGIKVVSTTRHLVYSWFIWEFHRRYPFFALNSNHHVDTVLNGQLLSSNTHIELLARLSKELVLTHNLVDYKNKEEILGLIYYIVNQLYNELPKIIGRYVNTIDILDILELAQDNSIVELKTKTEPVTTSIADFYNKAQKIILEKPEYRNNSLVQFIRMKILNMNQVNQCILARGFPVEVTGTILSTPIMSNYAMGMFKLYDYVTESRGASAHLYASDAPLQDTEYFARRLQLAGMVVEGIKMGDCGSSTYLPWLVKVPTYSNTGRMTYPGDLKFLRGKYYLDETSNSLKEINGKETDLYGKTILLRSVIHCQEKNPHLVCSTCFGALSHNVSRFANLGHLCDATLTQQLTQTILSTKHVIGSAVGADILLKENARRYLTFGYSSMSFYLKPVPKTSKLKLIVNRNMAISLTDLRLLNNIDQINPKRISALEEIEIREELENGTSIPTSITIKQNKRYGYFSHEFLKFIKDKGWMTNEYDHFVFDMSDWNPRYPLISIPDMEYSYADHAAEIANLIESNSDELKNRVKPEAPAMMLQELFDKVNSKIEVNLALLEVMIYASMTPNIDNFGMARNKPGSGLHVARSIISNRSLGTAYAYQHQFDIISDPRSFFKENRPSSPLDAIICPRETVAEIKSKTHR